MNRVQDNTSVSEPNVLSLELEPCRMHTHIVLVEKTVEYFFVGRCIRAPPTELRGGPLNV